MGDTYPMGSNHTGARNEAARCLSGVSVRAVSLARNGERGVLAACPEWSVTRPQRNWLNGGCGLQSVVRLQVVMTKSGDCAVAQPEELLHRREGSGAGVEPSW